jgi:hypothetical protein
MYILVSFKKIYGKELFYPESDDALFLAKFTGRPTLLKRQLKLCIKKGWDVVIKKETPDIKELGIL